MTDWRALTGRDLDRVIAVALGWRISEMTVTLNSASSKSGTAYILCDPTGLERVQISGDTTFAEAERNLWRHVDYYSTDANLPLPLAEGEQIEIFQFSNGKCMARILASADASDYVEGATIAEARARAWLAWQEQQK